MNDVDLPIQLLSCTFNSYRHWVAGATVDDYSSREVLKSEEAVVLDSLLILQHNEEL